MLRTPSPADEGRLDNTHSEYSGQYSREPRYFVGIDEMSTFRERIQEIYGDNSEITDAVSQLDEYFSDRSFEKQPEVQKFVSRVRRSFDNAPGATEIATELIDQGYIIALKRLGYRNAPKNVTFLKNYAKERGTCFVDEFMFGPCGTARMAFAEWLVEERLHGMHRFGKGPGPGFSEEAKEIWYMAEYKHSPWPHIEDADGETYLAEIPAKQGKLPQGTEELMRDSWRRQLYHSKDYAYTGMRPLRCGQNYQMIEDMVCTLLEDEGRPKMHRSPLSKQEQLRYNRIIEDANSKAIDPFCAVYSEMFSDPDALKPIWNKARRMLYEYSGVLRKSAMDAGLIERPDSIGITWHNKSKGWQAQITYKGRHKYLGLFKNKADAQAVYYKAAAEMGHIPGLPDIDKIWPTWTQEKKRLDSMNEYPRMPIVYQQQDTHEEKKYGLRPPEALRGLVERMKGVDWLAKHCKLAFDDNWPPASPDIAVRSRGRQWYEEIRNRGKRFVIQGCTSTDKDTGRIGITIYRPGFDNKRVLAEEIYHIGFKIIRYSSPKTFEAIQRCYRRQLRKGGDPTFSMPDMFSTNMALEESGFITCLPRCVVRHARSMLSVTSDVPDSVTKKIMTG